MNAGTKAGRWHSDSYRGAGFGQFYRDWQPREERCLPVLALHGSLTQSGMWSTLPDAAGGIRMLCPDQRGFGRSEDPGGDACAEFAADALALARDLLPARYVVMGHSFACSIALEVARLATSMSPPRCLSTLWSALARRDRLPRRPLRRREVFAGLEEAERHFHDTEEGEWTTETLRRFVRDIMLHDGESGPWRFPYTAARLRRLRAFTASPASDYDIFAKATAVRCPVLIFRGGLSKRFPAAAEKPFLDAFASKPDLVICPRSGHFPTATEPGIVGAALACFLDTRR